MILTNSIKLKNIYNKYKIKNKWDMIIRNNTKIKKTKIYIHLIWFLETILKLNKMKEITLKQIFRNMFQSDWSDQISSSFSCRLTV